MLLRMLATAVNIPTSAMMPMAMMAMVRRLRSRLPRTERKARNRTSLTCIRKIKLGEKAGIRNFILSDPPAIRSAMQSFSLHLSPDVHGVPQSVPQQIESKNHRHDRQAGNNRQERIVADDER